MGADVTGDDLVPGVPAAAPPGRGGDAVVPAAAGAPGASAALARLLRADPHELPALAPGLVAEIGRERLAQVLEAARQRVGEGLSVAAGAGGLTVQGRRGGLVAWVVCDPAGRIGGLLLRPQRRLEMLTRPLGVAWTWVTLALWPLLLGWTAVGAWRAQTVAAWSACALTALWLVLLHRGLGRPPGWVMTRALRAAIVVLALVPLAAAVRLPGLPRGSWSSGLTLQVSVLLAVATASAWSRRPDRLELVSEPLSSPFRAGRCVVVQGGRSRLLNHHVGSAAQRRALDLVLLRPSGARSSGVFPADLHRYASYAQELVAPCDGMVLQAVDSVPDQAPMQARLSPPYGNQVRIDTGRETVVLAHLRPGSLRVGAGQRVRRGQVIGEAGNSGHTSEPHLHLHAERDGLGLLLRFDGMRGPLRRGRQLPAPGSATPDTA